MKSILIDIACYLTTRTEGKKHGGYLVYEDDKVEISYDTYYPNVDVRVVVNGKKQTAAIYSGHGYTQEFHSGAWCKYVTDVLHPKALEAKKDFEAAKQEREKQRRQKSTAPLDDSKTFAA